MCAAPGEGPLDDPAAREPWPPHEARARPVSAEQHNAHTDDAVTSGYPGHLSSTHQVPHSS